MQRYRLHSAGTPVNGFCRPPRLRKLLVAAGLASHPQNAERARYQVTEIGICLPNHDTSKETLRSCMDKYGF